LTDLHLAIPGAISADPAAARRAIPAHARESAWHAPDGHAIRRIDWPRPAQSRGSLLFLGGRGDAYEKYLETLEYWFGEGWAVTAIDWRGQGGSGRLGDDDATGHIGDFAHWIDDLRGFWRDWKAESGANRPAQEKHVLIGHSMGGQLALRGVAEGAADPDALVLVAPMLGFAGPPLKPWMWHGAARVMAALGPVSRPAWKMGEKPGQPAGARQGILTHDVSRYEDELYWREKRPQLRLGAPSWGWVERAAESMRRTARADVLAKVTIPVLVLSTSADRLVSARAIRRAVHLLPDARLMEFGTESAHEILREGDEVRGRALSAIDDFLAQRLPADAAR